MHMGRVCTYIYARDSSFSTATQVNVSPLTASVPADPKQQTPSCEIYVNNILLAKYGIHLSRFFSSFAEDNIVLSTYLKEPPAVFFLFIYFLSMLIE